MRAMLKRFATSALALAIIVLVGASPAHAQLGIAGGLNFESSDDISTSSADANFENSTGYHIGVVYDAGFGPVNIRPGFFYRKVGTYEFGNTTGGGAAGTIDISTFEVPVDVRLNLLVTPVITPYVLAGPMLTIPRSNVDGFGNGDDFDDFTEDMSLSANVGAGVQLNLPAVPFKLQPELRYEFGISEYVDTDAVEVSESPKFSAFSLRLNVIF
ncbi:hypothetical protein CRI94_04910 [Longibacter salinarum]|uniref:Outer membrane protein beta-barrel domain-containing protein n=1 Tax=Longibacter salinarum TaxID=1850348 RepID=A0A2A8D0P1_9BACT|nr:outer membrane beta-barrel protein [Longibacter salinarum]PEN14377.1 hypothetical protein CRI94_04910 [Longibacter salinarum]